MNDLHYLNTLTTFHVMEATGDLEPMPAVPTGFLIREKKFLYKYLK